jgi:hypothetical protein
MDVVARTKKGEEKSILAGVCLEFTQVHLEQSSAA